MKAAGHAGRGIMLNIKNHRIEGAINSELPTGGSLATPRYLIIHYTAGDRVSGSLETLSTNDTSYHVLIDRDGSIHQVAAFNRRAGHAGVSNWKGRDDMNRHSISISLANFGGYLRKLPGGVWRAPGGKELEGHGVLEAEHHLGLSDVTGWERFKDPQIAAMLQVVAAVAGAYPTIIDAMGHDEVAMGRREDPGPAFPWWQVQAMFPKRTDDYGPITTVASPDGFASLRKRRSTSSNELARLGNGTELHLRSIAYVFTTDAGGKKVPVYGPWASVARKGTLEHAGFVARSLLAP